MFVVFSNFTNRINVVSWERDPHWDTETQTIIELDVAEYEGVTVPTPAGDMPFLEALWKRSGAFSLVAGELHHDDEYEAEE